MTTVELEKSSVNDGACAVCDKRPAQRLDAVVPDDHHVFGMEHAQILIIVPHRVKIKDLLHVNVRGKRIVRVHEP